ncbi:hypothetical protein GQ53DRAFT_740578 [Thozetella sp. PMI_491]|nr:hypothetical protein GQ53DRAFT_740578 [Thozetella sp. PMI_491]
MTESENDHARCRRTSPRDPWKQTTLVSKHGLMSIALPAPTPPRRTPAPHAVRRIANTPAFSTEDPRLTSFLRFPPEIRLVIYRLLLRVDGSIGYTLCPFTRRLVLEGAWYKYAKYPFERHGLFPAILECCLVTYNEGSSVLYGENDFSVRCGSYEPTRNSWPLGRAAMESISIVTMYLHWRPNETVSDERLHLLPRLKKLRYSLDLSVADWGLFLVEAADRLRPIRNVTLSVCVPSNEVQRILRLSGLRWTKITSKVAEAICWKLYQPPFSKYKDLWHHRRAKWAFYDMSDDYALCWQFSLTLES